VTTPSERRNAILQAASRLFEHYGHGKTTIADVAREAQVGVGTVYLEFESKDAIVTELSLSTHVGVLEAMRAASTKGSAPDERLSAVLVARTRCFLELGKKGQHACELVHCKTDGVRVAHQRFREQEQALIAGILQEGQLIGTFRSGEPKDTAALIQRAFASLSPPWIFSSKDEEAMRAAEGMCRLLLHGLKASSQPSQGVSVGSPSVAKRGKQSSARKPTRDR
jgi:AcrR family transcriptional regulator